MDKRGRKPKQINEKVTSAGFGVTTECYEQYRKLPAVAAKTIREKVREYAETLIKVEYGLELIAQGERKRNL